MSENTDQSPIAELLSNAAKALQKLKQFWRTKEAIDNGMPLYDWPSDKLKQEGYLGPWSFNAFETALTGGMAAIAANALLFFTGAAEDKAPIQIEGASPVFIGYLEQTTSWTQPFHIPILTTTVVFLIAWGSLHGRDSSKETRARARKAYLYFDGAYGFFSQLLIATDYALLSAYKPNSSAFVVSGISIALMVMSVILLLASLVQIYVTAKKIPQHMFIANGYSDRSRHFWQKAKGDDPPWNRFVFSHVIGGLPLVILVSSILYGIAYSLAYVMLWLKELFI